MRNISHFILGIVILLSAAPCQAHHYHHTVETFQLLQTSWDQHLYEDINREAFFHNNVQFKFNIAQSPEEEAAQIKKAVAKGVDAIIVNPYDVDTLLPAVEEAYDAGVYVILVGQKLPTFKYHAFAGTDSRALGTKSANYICNILPDGGNIILIGANTDAPYYKERVEGFNHVIDNNPRIHVVGRIDADWDANIAHKKLDSLQVTLGDTKVDVIYAFGDDMINGAIESDVYPDAIYVGGDGFVTNYFKYLEQGRLNASFINSTGGAEAAKAAVDILHANSYVKDNYVQPILVTSDEYAEFSISYNELQNYKHKIDILSKSVEQDSQHLRMINFIVIAGLILIILMILGTVHSTIKSSIANKKALNYGDKLAVIQEKNNELITQKEISEQMLAQLQAEREIMIEAAMSEKNEVKANDAISESIFIKRFREHVIENMGNSGLSIETIATGLGVSRAQLFRKI